MLSWHGRHRLKWKQESVTADEEQRGRAHEGTPLKGRKKIYIAIDKTVLICLEPAATLCSCLHCTSHRCPQVNAYKYFILLFHTAVGLKQRLCPYVQRSEMLLNMRSVLDIAGSFKHMQASTRCQHKQHNQLLVSISCLQEISPPPPKPLAEPAVTTSTTQRYSMCPLTRT